MKTLYFLLFCFVMSSSYSQDPQLFQYDWKLESLTTNDTILIVPDGMHFNAKFFPQSGNTYSYQLGFCHTLDGFIQYDNTNSFDLLGLSGLFEPCEGNEPQFLMEDYFHQNFIFDQPYISALDPFLYDFEIQNNFIYLNVTNNEGSIAVFYDNFLSQEGFLKDAISIYPNPFKDVLYLERSGIAVESLRIYDLNGQLIKEETLDHNQIEISQLSKGIYILHIETAVGILREKLIKN